MNPIKRFAFTFVLLLLSGWSQAQPGANPALYQAQKGELSVYVVGSIHAGKGNFYPLSPTIEQAFSKADALYLEIDPAQMQPQLMMQAMQKHALLDTPIPLKRRMSAANYQLFLKAIEKHKLPAHQLMFMRNWNIIVQLTVATIHEMGLNKEFGVDQHFAQKAAKAGKPVYGLETVEEQFAAISLMDEIDSKVLYENFFKEMGKAQQWLVDVEQAWRSGNSQKLSQLYQEYDERQDQAELMQVLLDKRNKNWQQAILKLSPKQTYMLVVGDMHVHGEGNILKLLKEVGFSVTRLNPIS